VISAPQQGQYLVHVAGEVPVMFTDLPAALAFAHEHLLAALTRDMAAAGAPVFETKQAWHEQTVDLGGTDMFVEGSLTLTASGRPELAR
jgi:hypothetical protein